ncbi:MAG: hypothetical protein GX897_00915 [Clostridiales bacterium]|nr:hypothetical protein [Clostridiales bacterium]
MKKFVSLLITVLLISSVLGFGVFAADYTVPFATTEPKIDGIIDDIWSIAEEIIPAEIHDDEDMCTGYVKLLWTPEALYALEVVKDSTLLDPPDEATFTNWVDLWISEKNTQTDSYDTDEGDYHVGIDFTGISMPYTGNPAIHDVVEFKVNLTSDGYITEVKIPFLTIAPAEPGHVIGFNVTFNDDIDKDGKRDSYATWMEQEGREGYYWSSTYLNTVIFGDIPTETEEPVAVEEPAAEAPAEAAPAPVAEAAPAAPAPAAQTGDISALLVLVSVTAAAGIAIAKKER